MVLNTNSTFRAIGKAITIRSTKLHGIWPLQSSTVLLLAKTGVLKIDPFEFWGVHESQKYCITELNTKE
jgi:hypothetical protein